MVRRFEGQDETTKHLEALQKDNEKQITRLKEDKEKLQMEFEEMKYTGDAKLSRSVHRSCQTLKVIHCSSTNWLVPENFLWNRSRSAIHVFVHDCMCLFCFASGERMLEEFQSHLQKEEDRRSHAEDNLNRNSNIMVSVKAGVEHLSDKLHHLKAVSLNHICVYIYKFYSKKSF